MTAVRGVSVELKKWSHDYSGSSITIQETDKSIYRVELNPGLGFHGDQLFVNSHTILGILYPGQFQLGTVYAAWREIYRAIRGGDAAANCEAIDHPETPLSALWGGIPSALLLALAIHPKRLDIPLQSMPDRKLRDISEQLNRVAVRVEGDVSGLQEAMMPRVDKAIERAEEILSKSDEFPDRRQRRHLAVGRVEFCKEQITRDVAREFTRLAAARVDPQLIAELTKGLKKYLNIGRLYEQVGFRVQKKGGWLGLPGKEGPVPYRLSGQDLPRLPGEVDGGV